MYGYFYTAIQKAGLKINYVFDNFNDGTTFMTLGVIDGVLSLWHTQTEEVIAQWTKEE